MMIEFIPSAIVGFACGLGICAVIFPLKIGG